MGSNFESYAETLNASRVHDAETLEEKKKKEKKKPKKEKEVHITK